MKMKLVACLAAALVCVWLGPARPPVAGASTPVVRVRSDKFDDAQSLITDALRERLAASVAVGVSQGGKITWLEAFGLANGPQRIKATAHTAYPIGSITEALTATAVMALAERGRIDIDKPAEKYMEPLEFTACKGRGRDVTVKHLLNHTAGLPVHFNRFYDGEGHSPPTIEETAAHYAILVREPGKTFQRSDLGYGLLGHIISRVSGIAYGDFMRKHVFEPLGMMTTWIGPHPEWAGITAETYDARLRPLPPVRTDTPAAGEGFSCAYDLLRFAMFQLENRLPDTEPPIGAQAIEAMQTGVDESAEYAAGDLYAMGWFVTEDDNGFRTVWQESSTDGASGMLKLVPSENIAVVVLINGPGDGLPRRIVDSALGALLPAYRKNLEAGSEPRRPGLGPFEPAPDLIGEWKGKIMTYGLDIPVRMVFQQDGDIHFLKPPDIDNTWVLQDLEYFDEVLNEVGMDGNRIRGWVDARVATGDAMRSPHVLLIDIVREGDSIDGSVTAVSAAERIYFGLSYCIHLERQDR